VFNTSGGLLTDETVQERHTTDLNDLSSKPAIALTRPHRNPGRPLNVKQFSSNGERPVINSGAVVFCSKIAAFGAG